MGQRELNVGDVWSRPGKADCGRIAQIIILLSADRGFLDGNGDWIDTPRELYWQCSLHVIFEDRLLGTEPVYLSVVRDMPLHEWTYLGRITPTGFEASGIHHADAEDTETK